MRKEGTPVKKPMRAKSLARCCGAACREARLRLGLTQAEVAERVGIAYEVYGRLERGNMSPSVHTLRKLCLVLKVSADTALALHAPEEAPDALPPPGKPKDAHLRRLVRRARHLTRRALAYLSALLPQEKPPAVSSGKSARAEQA